MTRAQANQIPLERGDLLTDESFEVARVWITNGAGSSVWIEPILEDPHVFGILMADTVRHAAKAYAARDGIEEDAALQAIVDGLGEELREQFNDVTTIQQGGTH